MYLNYLGLVVFGLALVHVLACPYLRAIAKPQLKLLSEVELVFGYWAIIYIIIRFIFFDSSQTLLELKTLNFREPIFVAIILLLAATRPVLLAAQKALFNLTYLLPVKYRVWGYVFLVLTLGSLLGSLITEPAAITVVVLLLKDIFFNKRVNAKVQYQLLAVLLVNISIGGALTPFAAPAIVMIAKKWNWSLTTTLSHFALKVGCALLVNTIFFLWFNKSELKALIAKRVIQLPRNLELKNISAWLTISHFLLIGLTIIWAHQTLYLLLVLIIFGFLFWGSKKQQSRLAIKESVLVGAFLAGLVVLGQPQGWWIEPIIRSLTEFKLFLAAILLTSFTDNAALTYLGSLIEGIPFSMQYALVAGAVAGGGLTVIANAPNPVALALLEDRLENGSIQHFKLFKAAIFPTVITALILWCL